MAGVRLDHSKLVDDVDPDDGDDVGGHDPPYPVPRVAAHPRGSPAGRRGPHPWAEEQEAGQHEEYRHSDFQPGEDQPQISVGQRAGAVSRVRPDDQQCSDRADTCQRGDPVGVGDLLKTALINLDSGTAARARVRGLRIDDGRIVKSDRHLTQCTDHDRIRANSRRQGLWGF